MKTRILISVVLLPVFLAVLCIFPPFILTALVSVISAIAAYELMCAVKAPKRLAVYAILASIPVPIVVYISSLPVSITDVITEVEGAIAIHPPGHNQTLTFISSILVIFLFKQSTLLIDFFLTHKTKKRAKLRHYLTAPVAGMVIPYMLSSLIGLRTMPLGYLLVLLPIVSAFLTDSGAYFTGVSIGKRKAFPIISPNKTIEGCVGGLVIGAAGILLFGFILTLTTSHTVLFPLLIIYGLTGAIITEFGDLAFSFVKRKCGIKDYGKLIPGHGGILDRFDSMIFTAPTMFLLVTLLPAII
jgi:phosphatidate cytidylyltransferase